MQHEYNGFGARCRKKRRSFVHYLKQAFHETDMVQQMNGSNTLLLVEDDAHTAVRLLRGLQDEGFRPLHAGDGAQGLAYARATRPDLVVLDAGLPCMDGFAVCRTLRAESVVPIIMLSANGHAEDRVRGLELGADDVVARPFDVQELVARVRALFRRRDRCKWSPPRPSSLETVRHKAKRRCMRKWPFSARFR